MEKTKKPYRRVILLQKSIDVCKNKSAVEKINKTIAHAGYWIQKFLLYIHNCYWSHIYNVYREEWNIDDTFSFRGTDISISPHNYETENKLVVGKNGHIGSNSKISLHGGNVLIGDNCLIGSDFEVFTKGWDSKYITSGVGFKKQINYGDVVIKDNVWIGRGVTVFGGVVIGANSVIGSHSIVTKTMPSNCVAVGSSARVVKREIR